MSIQANFPAIVPSLNLSFALTKALDPRITFTRASTATYYGAETAKAEENLLVQSQTFETAGWGVSGAAVTANTQTAPDGTSTADVLTATAATSVHNIGSATISLTAAPHAYSVFVKAGTNNFVQLRFGAAFGTLFANFDLSVGTVGTSSGGTAAITSVGNGWYRCSLIGTTLAASSSAQIYIVSSGSAAAAESWTTVGTESIILWGAQLEQRSAATNYTPTTAQTITNYIPVLKSAASGVARFDHNPTTFESLGLLIEESRANLILQSEDLDTSWSETRATLSLNGVVSPSGTLTADKLIASTDNNTHFTSQTFTGTAASHTFTVYAKANGLNHVALRLFNGTSQVGLAYYNLSTGATGTVTAGTASITTVGNGFFRCSLTATLAASASCTADIQLANADNTNSFIGDAFDGVSLWGTQVELGAFATSYIPTVASQVTRAADTASMTGTNFSNWYNAAEGTVYTEFNPMVLAASSGIVINNNTTSNRIRLATTSVSDQGTVTTSGTAQAVLDGGTPAANTSMKLAMTYQVNNFALSLNSATATTDTSGTVPVVSQLQIGAETTTVGNLTIKRFAFYPIVSTATQLQALTS